MQTLNKKYNVYTSNNGQQALDILKQKNVSMIISDVMIPKMSGYELCSAVKNNIELSYIPIFY